MSGRWDILLRGTTGPLAALGTQVRRGPSVLLGTQPGAGGLALSAVRGVQPQHCRITVADDGTASVSPIGTNPVRMAPYAQVDWAAIEPLAGTTLLAPGSALHIGPAGRGATLVFEGCQPLGTWTGGAAASSGALQSQRIRPSWTPAWVVGCLFLLAGSTTATLLVAGSFIWLFKPVPFKGEIVEHERFRSVSLEGQAPEDLLEGLQAPFDAFVMRPNRELSGGQYPELDDPSGWDARFFEYVTRSVEAHGRQRAFFRKLEAKHVEYARVVLALRDAGLPEVFAAIPYQESLYEGNRPSWACANGYWQFMPEVAHRVDTQSPHSLEVRGCRLRGSSELWRPTDLAAPDTSSSPYIEDRKCQIVSCRTDERTDLDKSTAAAIWTLSRALEDPDIASSGAAVQLTILSHHTGYNDEPWLGRKRRTNVLPALRRWVRTQGSDQGPLVYGANILCASHEGTDRCGSAFMPATQHYAYNIVAQHLLAVCYYGAAHGEERAFAPWTPWALEGYCRELDIPTRAEVRG